MVDSNKRRSLKSLGGMMAMPLVPGALIPGMVQADTMQPDATVMNVASNEELNISLILGDKPVMRVTNNSDTLTILRRVHPGVVHAGAKSYDLNQSLRSSAYAIGAGLSRTIPISEAISTVAETASHANRPLRLASITADNKDGRVLSASRAFFA